VKKQLPVSAAAINDAHRCARESAENAVEWAIKCGKMLAELKASLPRGEFDGWVESNCEFGRATAYNYIRASKSSNALDGSAIRHLFPSGRPGAKSNTPKGAVSVVKAPGDGPEATEETGEDRPAASATPPERASQPPGAEVRPGARPVEVTPEQKRVAQQVRESLNRQQAQTETEDDAPEQPSDDEIAAIEREIQESEARVLQADDVMAGYHQELKRQAAEIAVLKTTRDGYMRGKDAVTKLLQAEQRKNAKLTKRIQELEKENKALRERLEGKAS
jgi:uncharacterized protein YhaN